MGVLVTNSTLKTYQRCKRMYWYKVDRKLSPNTSPLPMKRGVWLHELLQAYYQTGDWRPRLKELKSEYDRMFDEEKEMYGDLPEACRRIMTSYEYNYQDEDSQMEVIAAEEAIEVSMGKHRYELKFDLISEDEYGRWLWEHKSHKSLPRSDYRFLDVQTARYVWALNKDGRYGEITGVIWNYLRMKPPTVPKILKNGTISTRKIETDLHTYLEVVRDNHLDPKDYRDVLLMLKNSRNPFFVRERVPKPKAVIEELVKEAVYTANEIERGYKPIRSIERSCEFQCSYKDICITDLYGGDSAQVIRDKYHIREEGEYYGDRFEDAALDEL